MKVTSPSFLQFISNVSSRIFHRSFLFILVLLRPGMSLAEDPPPADDSFRKQMVEEKSAACAAGIEAAPDLKVLYSHRTVEAYCNCRQKYVADIYAQALKEGRRGKEVQDRGAEYAAGKCRNILLQHLEHEPD